MPNAFDTILASALNPGAGPTAATAAGGDSLTIRSAPATSKIYLEGLVRMGTAAGFVQVRSPLLHDTSRGIRITPGESPSVYSLPGQAAQELQSQDTLIVELSGGAAETDIAALQVYYENLLGSSPRLAMPGDVIGNIDNIKPLAVAVTSSATVGQWSDTGITTTENLLHANTDYAVLGYMTNTALGVIGVKGQDTGNLRVCGAGAVNEYPTTQYFLQLSQETGRPHIPVINSANAGATFVSVAAATVSVAATVELILAELVRPFPG